MRAAFRPFFGEQKVALSRIRLTCSVDDRKSLQVKSTCGPTQKLDTKTDEDIAFTDRDLVIIKNCGEECCALRFKALELPEGRRAIFRPSRQGAQTLYDSRVSEIRSECSLKLGGGEALVIVTSEWVAGRGQGAGAPVVV